VKVPDTACRRWQHWPGPGEKIHGFDESGRVRSARARQGPHDPGVATFFLGFLELAACPPRQRTPPVQAEHQQFQATNPVVAAAQVRQFMDEQGSPLFSVQPVKQVGGEYQARDPSNCPQQG
jgi:hypothetical protein